MENSEYIIISGEIVRFDSEKYQINMQCVELCKQGNVKLVENFVKLNRKFFNLGLINPRSTTGLLWELIEKGHIEVMKYLFTAPDIKGIPDLFTSPFNEYNNDTTCLEYLTHYGHQDFIKYLLTSPDVKEDININNETIAMVNKNLKIQVSSPFLLNCMYSKSWDMVSLLLTNKNLLCPITISPKLLEDVYDLNEESFKAFIDVIAPDFIMPVNQKDFIQTLLIDMPKAIDACDLLQQLVYYNCFTFADIISEIKALKNDAVFQDKYKDCQEIVAQWEFHEKLNQHLPIKNIEKKITKI